MKRVLFVDDEPNVLDGLRRMLRQQRGEWEMGFVSGGEEALEIMEKTPYDVVVSDLRMPDLPGGELLKQIKERFPNTVRIVLSGTADLDSLVRMSDVVHQFLTKPCEPDVLVATVKRASAVPDLLASENIKKLVGRLEFLPALPSIFGELTQELDSPDASLKKVAAIISKDIALTAKVMQFVNSAYFGPPRHIAQLDKAVGMLGLKAIKAITLSVHVFSQIQLKGDKKSLWEDLWEHSLRVGSSAKAIVKMENGDEKTQEYALVAGLLHDIGILVLASELPTEYQKVLEKAQGSRLTTAEKELIGASHPEIGAYLMFLWGLPNPIVEAIAFHHSPSSSFAKEFTPLTAVHVADNLEMGMRLKEGHPLGRTYLAKLGLMERLPDWQAMCQQLWEQSGDFN